MLTESENQIRIWLEECHQNHVFPSKQEFKEKCIFYLTKQKFAGSFSRQYFDKLFSRIAPDYTMQTAQQLDQERFEVSSDTLQDFFQKLKNSNFESIPPDLIINIDETGFGGTKRRGNPKITVIVPHEYIGPVYTCSANTKKLMSAIVSISAFGRILKPGIITDRETEHPDAGECPFYSSIIHYKSPKAFVNTEIFEHYLSLSVIPYIENSRKELNNFTSPAAIRLDGHKSHLSVIAKSFLANYNIQLYLLPPHSSHLIQPLDQGFFRKAKVEYGTLPNYPNVSKISCRMQKIATALEIAANKQTIILSWKNAGFFPVIKNGEVEKIRIEYDIVLNKPALKNKNIHVINERERGKKAESCEYGFLNERQFSLKNAGFCPLCESEISNNETLKAIGSNKV